MTPDEAQALAKGYEEFVRLLDEVFDPRRPEGALVSQET